ncbi:MAG: sulfite exporter TauE/SafE family protein [Candidatus Thorarchaeota archaeon]|nr:sulfite exporter TauE/SafE family protein [Candidatus Thorarchaeota archaeon]
MQIPLIADPLMLTCLAVFAIGVGAICSMLGIGGGTINTPLLIVVFALAPAEAAATSLVAAMFVSLSGSFSYHRRNPRLIILRVGLFLTITTIPGSVIGAWLKSVIEDMLLRYIFSVVLFPIALKMLFTKPKGRSDMESELDAFSFSDIPKSRLVGTLAGAFLAGLLSGLLGLGGGVVIVPLLTMYMGIPMHAAVATSMFAMVFTTAAGTVTNIGLGEINLLYGLALGVGMLVGAQAGARLACRVNSVRLKQAFGVMLAYPLVSLARLGELLVTSMGHTLDAASVTLANVVIWLAIVLPVLALRLAMGRPPPPPPEPQETCVPPVPRD